MERTEAHRREGMPLVQHPAAFTGAGNDEGLRRRRVVGGSNGIFVRRSAGEAITLEWDGLETVADVKAMIYEKECIHPTLQRLMFGRRLLYNDRTLAHYNIQKGSTIHLLKSDLGDGKGKNSIIVKKLTGDIIMLKVELRETTVAYVRGMIAEKAGIRQAQQHLVFHGRPLDDSNTLAHYGIEEDSVLHLAPGRRGGGGPPKMERTEAHRREGMPLVQHPAAFAGAGDDEGLRRRRVGGNNIFVRRSAGEVITLEWDGLKTVADVKAMIYEKECIHPTLQRLMFGRRLLYNDRTLTHYNIQKGSTIHLLKNDLGDGKGKNSIHGRPLDDSNTLADYGIKENSSVLHLAPGRRGGGGPPEMGIIAAHRREPMPPNGLRGHRVEGKTKLIVRMTRTGRKFILELDLFKTIAGVKYMIYDKEGIPPDQQYFVFDGQQLDDDDRTLADYNIPYGSSPVPVLHLLVGARLDIFVKKITGEILKLHVEFKRTVFHVLHWINYYGGKRIHWTQQHLVFEGQPLDYHRTLTDYNIRPGSTLHLALGPSGARDRPEMDKIYIRTMTGVNLTLKLDLSKTIADVKDMIEDMEGIPPDHQRFVFKGRQLETACTLADCNIHNGSTIHLVVRLRGGGMNIFVQKLTGEIFELGVGCMHSISEIRDMINEKEGIHRTQQHLVLDGLPLDDDRTLQDYNIHDGSILNLALVPLPLGAGSSPEENGDTGEDIDSSSDEDEEEDIEIGMEDLSTDDDEEENELESSEESTEKDEYGLVQTEQPWARDHGHDQLSSGASWALVAADEAIDEQEEVTGDTEEQPSENMLQVNVHGIGALADQLEQKRKRWYKYSLKNLVFAISILATYLGSASTSSSIGKVAFKIAIGATFLADAALSILMPPKWGNALVYLSWFLVVLVSYLLLVSFNKYYGYAILLVPLPIVVALLQLKLKLRVMQQRRPGNEEAVQNADPERANQDQNTNNDEEDDQNFDRIFELSGDIVNCGGIITVIFGNSMVGPASALGFLFFYTVALGLYLMMVTTVRAVALTPHARFLAILLKVLLVITLITSLIHGV